MKRTSTTFFLILAFFLAISVSLQAQPEEAPPKLEMLHPSQLEREPWFYSLEKALENPEKVYKLSLVGQKLKEIPAEISELVNLQLLNLGENKIKKIPAELMDLKKLQFLSLFDNKLKSIPEELKYLTHLEVLFLGRNRISILPVWVGGLGKLRRLDLTYNRVTPAEMNAVKYVLPRCTITP